MITPEGAGAPLLYVAYVPAPRRPALPPEPVPSRPWFAVVFGTLVTALAVGAIVLATQAPSLAATQAKLMPTSWTQQYSADLRTDTSGWAVGQGCQALSRGLHATTPSACLFQPGGAVGNGGVGFLFQVTVAPGADVAGPETPVVVFDDVAELIISQQGTYALVQPSGKIAVTSDTVAWHTDGYQSNTIAFMYQPNASSTTGTATPDLLTIFINGQRLLAAAIPQPQSSNIAIGAASVAGAAAVSSDPGDEALFTRAQLFAAG